MSVMTAGLIGAWVVGVVRASTGLLLLAVPHRAARKWVGEDSTATTTLLSGIGGRDLAIGAGVIWAILTDNHPAAWVAASLAGDVTDAVAGLRLSPHRSDRTLKYAGGFAAINIASLALLLAG